MNKDLTVSDKLEDAECEKQPTYHNLENDLQYEVFRYTSLLEAIGNKIEIEQKAMKAKFEIDPAPSKTERHRLLETYYVFVSNKINSTKEVLRIIEIVK